MAITLGPNGTYYDSTGNPLGTQPMLPTFAPNPSGLGPNTSPVQSPISANATAAMLNGVPASQALSPSEIAALQQAQGGYLGPALAQQTASGPMPTAPQTIAPFSGVNYPEFTPPPLPAALQQPWTLPTTQDLQNMPGFQASFDLGERALQRSAAAQGSLLSGGTLQALNRYGQDYAMGKYNDLVNQSIQQRQQQANDYLSLMYGPAWQQSQAAVGQYQNLYGQYQDLIQNNRQAQNDYINALLAQENIGVGAGKSTAPAPISPTSVQ